MLYKPVVSWYDDATGVTWGGAILPTCRWWTVGPSIRRELRPSGSVEVISEKEGIDMINIDTLIGILSLCATCIGLGIALGQRRH